MTFYCHQTNDIVDIVPRSLPRAWRNISGLDKASASELKLWGWLPVVYVNETYDSATQIRTGPVGCNIGDAVPQGADEVPYTYTVRDKTAQELEDEKDARAQNVLDNHGLKAFIFCINDGSIVPGANVTAAQLKAAIKAKM